MSAPFPHCNSETLHAPGECFYCDKYPHSQAARIAFGEPFSPNEANGWSGNVAVKAGETHSHMGATYVVGDSFDEALEVLDGERKCSVNFKRGWYCTRNEHGPNPCALVPKWWNVRAQRWVRRLGKR